jgi:hypothetical protein
VPVDRRPRIGGTSLKRGILRVSRKRGMSPCWAPRSLPCSERTAA